MLIRLLIAFALVSVCVILHATALVTAMHWLKHSKMARLSTYWREMMLLIIVAGWMIFAHLLEIMVWAVFYNFAHAMPNIHDAFYFSAVTYTTVGYGDLVLPAEWRLLGGVEALNGILMCGWSTGFFFATVNRMFQTRVGISYPAEHEGKP